MWKCIVLLTVHISLYSDVYCEKSRQQSGDPLNIWARWTQPEATLESLHLTADDIIITSPDIDVNAESSATRNEVSVAPRPFNVMLLPDALGEVEKLRSDLDKIMEFTSKAASEAEGYDTQGGRAKMEQSLLSTTSLDDEIVPLRSFYYQKPLIYMPTLLLYLLMLPLGCKLLYGGRALVHEHIPVVTTFGAYFVTHHFIRALFGDISVLTLVCSLAAYMGHRVSMKPLKTLRLAPRGIRREPIGWMFEILCVCGIMANVTYRALLTMGAAIIGKVEIYSWMEYLSFFFYRTYMTLVSGAILVAMIKLVPTYFAQELVFAFSSMYIILSGISFFNDVLVYNSIIDTGIVGLDPAVFFVPEPPHYWGSGFYITALCQASFYVALSSSWRKASPGDHTS